MRLPAVYPKIARMLHPIGATNRPFPLKAPEGVTLHLTADRNLARAVQRLRSENLAFHLIIDRSGAIHQMAPFTHAVPHVPVGEGGAWNKKDIKRRHAAIALVSWGMLQSDKGLPVSWAKEPVPEAEVFYDGKRFWDRATDAQADALLEALRWFVAFGLCPADVCAISETSATSGPEKCLGGVLPCTPSELRCVLSHPPKSVLRSS